VGAGGDWKKFCNALNYGKKDQMKNRHGPSQAKDNVVLARLSRLRKPSFKSESDLK